LFKSKNFQRSTTELMVIVTPTIVDTTVAPGAEPQTPVMPYEPLNNGAFDATLNKAKPAATTEAPKN
jgi:Flp pilus assembly secretin CpaC